MKSTTALAALFGIVFAAATSTAFAQSSTPGTAPGKPNRVTVVPPPPPPPQGPDKLTTRPQPPGPEVGIKERRGPKVVDDLAGDPNWQESTCFPANPQFDNCVASLDKICTEHGGGMSTNEDGSVTCTEYN